MKTLYRIRFRDGNAQEFYAENDTEALDHFTKVRAGFKPTLDKYIVSDEVWQPIHTDES